MVALNVPETRRKLGLALEEGLEMRAEEAAVTLDHLIRSEQSGKHDHGLIRVAYLIESGHFGPYGRAPAPEPERVAPGRLHVDGAGHIGYAVMQNLIDAGCREVAESGQCLLTSSSVYPSGALGDWAGLAIERGIGILLVASSPPRVASPGGVEPVIGTNPICIGMPTAPFPFVADCTTSAITHGALLLARASGEALPENSAVNAAGEPTTLAAEVDPAHGIGALLPTGGSHKAFALGMGVELLVGLGGGVPGSSKRGTHGVFGLLIGPDLLEHALPVMSGWLDDQAEGGLRIPGWNSQRLLRDQQERETVMVPPETMDRIRRWLA